MNAINRILVPMDLSGRNLNAYKHAQEIASRHAAKIDVIHIIPMWRYFSESLEQLNMPLDMEDDLYPNSQEWASAKINKLMDRYLDPESKGKAVVRISHNPSRVITEYAEEGNYDLIVMDSGRHTADLLGGSITKKVIHHSHIPVLHTDASDSETDVAKDAVPA